MCILWSWDSRIIIAAVVCSSAIAVVVMFVAIKFSIISKRLEIITSFVLHASFSDWICSWYNAWESDSVFSDFALNCSNYELKMGMSVDGNVCCFPMVGVSICQSNTGVENGLP